MAHTADDDSIAFLEEAERGPGRAPLLLLAMLLLVALVAGGWWLMRDRPEEQGEGALIAAPPGPYKVKDTIANGMDIPGQGDTAFAASQGQEPQGQIDLAAAPETPIAVKRAKPEQTEATKPVETGPALSGPGIVQLGSFDTREKAERAWGSMSGRFEFLKGKTHAVQSGEVIGRTVYRLRASAGAEAATVCSQLKAAGENCLVVG